MHPRHLRMIDFTYYLPEEKIAKHPLGQRDESKLLIYKNGNISESIFKYIPEQLPTNSLLIFNNSKVIEARLLFKKESGGLIEIFVLEPYKIDVSTAMQTQLGIDCLCLVGGLDKWKITPLILIEEKLDNTNEPVKIELIAHLIEKLGESCRIRFEWYPSNKTFAEILHLLGKMPIPPYLSRRAEDSDSDRYQTIYAKADGSVAAPTAGLHFTPPVMANLKEHNIATAFVTLHVGAGTFKPVKSETIEGHNMHAEYLDVDIELIKKLIRYNKIIPVGTTSMRTIESIYWMGAKIFFNPSISMKELEMKQWEIYDGSTHQKTSKAESLSSLLKWMEQHKMQRLIIPTQILIAPSYKSKIATGIITNFHQPKSTLLLLIAALVGDNWKNIYDYALENHFRFLSYGDGSYLDFDTAQ